MIEDGGAPSFQLPGERIITPDLLVAHSGCNAFCEVKWKTAPVLHQRTRTWRHGVDEWNWENYLFAQEQTGIRGWLYIVECKRGPHEQDEPHLLTQSFDVLQAVGFSHDGDGDAKVWWDVEVFQRRALSVNTRGRVEIPRSVRPWERVGRDGTAPRWEPA